MTAETGKWIGVFWAMILCDLVADALSMFWLKPVAKRTIRRAEEMAAATGQGQEPRAA